MTWIISIAAILGLIGIQFIPLPKWKLLFSLSALSLMIVGIDLIAMRHITSFPEKQLLVAGALIGIGTGYFLKLFRSALTKNNRIQISTEPSQKNKSELATSIAEKMTQLGGHLADPASDVDIEYVETRLDISLPLELRTFLLKHDGTTKPSDIGMWSFWSCLEITNYTLHTGRNHFTAFVNNPKQTIQLPSDRLILFADAMIHAPVYAVYLAPGETYHGSVFELLCGSISAHSFKDWTNLFLSRGEDGVL